MDFNAYQFRAKSTAQYPDRNGPVGLYYTALGLVSEAGEVAGKVKKVIRDDNGQISDEKKKQILDEVGDVLWYCAMIADELNTNFGYVAEINANKLEDRKHRGVIKGSGDNR